MLSPSRLRGRFPRPSPLTVLFWTAVLALEAALVLTYVTIQNAQLGLFHVYPFVWINVGGWVLWKTSLPAAPRRRHLLAGGIAGVYFLVLGFLGGLYGIVPLFDHPEQHLHHLEQMRGFDLAVSVPPGYGPALFYTSPTLTLSISPYLLVGYVALAYLIYVTVLDAANAAAPGVLGVFACISCTWPLLASLVGGIGTSGAMATAVYAQAYELSTLAFVVTVGLLYWRPLR